MRSKAAAQLLLAQGYSNIFNMSGGIIAFDGGKAVGGEDFGMEFFVSGDFQDAFRMSYAMEEGLRQLYLALEETTEDEEARLLLAKLAKFEDGHKAKLKAMFPEAEECGEVAGDNLEGGFDRQQILDHFRSRIDNLHDILELGMMLETQAFDLYSRLSRKSEDSKSKELFDYLAEEEKLHLNFLSREYDKLLL
ncbi:MAG: ferritin family protein [Thermodesulfobacteriota bacterium]